MGKLSFASLGVHVGWVGWGGVGWGGGVGMGWDEVGWGVGRYEDTRQL